MSHRLTSATLTTGVVLGGLCFAVALAAEVTGTPSSGGGMGDIAVLAAGVASLRPWAWAALGTHLLIVTPVVGLVVTAVEHALARDRRGVALALLVLAILASSYLVAVLG